jgi:hypothetical protein
MCAPLQAALPANTVLRASAAQSCFVGPGDRGRQGSPDPRNFDLRFGRRHTRPSTLVIPRYHTEEGSRCVVGRHAPRGTGGYPYPGQRSMLRPRRRSLRAADRRHGASSAAACSGWPSRATFAPIAASSPLLRRDRPGQWGYPRKLAAVRTTAAAVTFGDGVGRP